MVTDPDTPSEAPTPWPQDALLAMSERAVEASAFLKAMSHEGRLTILCQLVDGEKSVTQLEQLLQLRQAAVSQHLSRLRTDGLVTPRRDGKTIFYRLADDRAQKMLETLHDLFCGSEPHDT